MFSGYFNYTFHVAQNRLDRWNFARRWMSFYAGDRRWVPPYYPDFRRVLEPGSDAHLARLTLQLISATALTRAPVAKPGAGPDADWSMGFRPLGVIEDRTVAAAILAFDPRAPGGPASLVSLETTNDAGALERLLDVLLEAAAESGHAGLAGPTGFSPYLGAGILESHWDRLPPLHTPYQPPYVADLAAGAMERLGSTRLYSLDVSADIQAPEDSHLHCLLFEPRRLADDLLQLFAAACSPAWPGCPSLDAEEAAFLLSWAGRWPLSVLLALAGEEPVGFVLLQPDLADRLRRANGGRGLHLRTWLRWAARQPVQQGRLLFGGVLPTWRGRGVGTALLSEAVIQARSNGWRCLNIGPVPDESAGAAFLLQRGASPEQQYGIYASGAEVESWEEGRL